MTESCVRADDSSAAPVEQVRARKVRPRRYVMTPPDYFTVEYQINPWMDPITPTDRHIAEAQWGRLYATYQRLGHTVEVVPPRPGLPDMVYAANAGLIVGEMAVLAHYKYAARAPESLVYGNWMTARGYRVVPTRHVNEGQGDLLLVGDKLLGGYGFRTDIRAHAEIARILQMPVISLELVDPRFYHLDTALAVLDENSIAYYPPAFSDAANSQLRALFPDAIVVGSADAYALGLNAASDGLHVVHSLAATGFAAQLRAAGFESVGVDLSELLKGGGSVKCCTLELYP